jgi:hypothetical protein
MKHFMRIVHLHNVQKEVEVHQKLLNQIKKKQVLKKNPKKEKQKEKLKNQKEKQKEKAKGKSLVNKEFMNSLINNRYIPDNRSGIQLIEHYSYGMNPDGSRITPRVEEKIKTTQKLDQNPKPTIQKTRKHK